MNAMFLLQATAQTPLKQEAPIQEALRESVSTAAGGSLLTDTFLQAGPVVKLVLFLLVVLSVACWGIILYKYLTLRRAQQNGQEFSDLFSKASSLMEVYHASKNIPSSPLLDVFEAGYREQFNLGLITTSGSLGLLFAPSLPLILYGIIAEQSVDKLFIAGILPGMLMLFLLALWCMREGRFVRKHSERQRFNRRELVAAFRESIWEIPLPVIVLGGVYSGFFAVSEAAVVTVLYVLVVEVVINRDIPFRKVPQIMRDSMMLVGGILIILGASLASTNLMIDQEVPVRLFEFVTAHVSSKLGFLILLNLFLLALGMMLDIFSALVIVVPLILPIAAGYGIDPIHLGMIFLANMQIGYCTPPVGMNLFIASYRFDRPIMLLYRATIPFLIILFASVLIITYWPWLSLVLVR